MYKFPAQRLHKLETVLFNCIYGIFCGRINKQSCYLKNDLLLLLNTFVHYFIEQKIAGLVAGNFFIKFSIRKIFAVLSKWIVNNIKIAFFIIFQCSCNFILLQTTAASPMLNNFYIWILQRKKVCAVLFHLQVLYPHLIKPNRTHVGEKVQSPFHHPLCAHGVPVAVIIN